MNFVRFFVGIFLTVTTVAHGAQIFGIAPMYGQSHWNVMDAVFQTLVSAGHNLTVVTPFMKKEKIANYTQIDSSSYMIRGASVPFDLVAGIQYANRYLIEMHQASCEAFYKSDEFWTALKWNKYDLFITQLMGSKCDTYIAHKLQVPMIAVTTSAMPTWLNEPFGNPMITSFTSTLNSPMAVPKTFWDRLVNSVDFAVSAYHNWAYDGRATEIGRTYFGEDAPDAEELMKNVSLVFVNSHFTFHMPRPWVPNLIEIGGIHVDDPKPLPEDIRRFIDDAPDGIVYFSFGSTVKMNSLPSAMQNSLQEAFAKLPQRVLWKYDGDVMENQPSNVMIKKWFPQRDILAHPKFKLFIYHGGLSGMNEAIVNQVPILGIPLFSDQFRNIANAVHLGMGLSLDYRTLDAKSVLEAATEIINNEKYKKNVQELYKRYKDRPMSQKQLVTYWTEYVIKHKGAQHMRSAAIDLTWYQYFLIDILTAVVFFVLFSFVIIFVILKTLTKRIYNLTKSKKKNE